MRNVLLTQKLILQPQQKNLFNSKMNWQHLTDLNQLSDIVDTSFKQPDEIQAVLIFKHSTRCSISSMALNRLENKWTETPKIPVYFLDLIQNRAISNKIAEIFNIEHASPQVLLIKNGQCFYTSSHSAISVADISEAISKQIQ
jgi:bacillithiol system protein YtxJ